MDTDYNTLMGELDEDADQLYLCTNNWLDWLTYYWLDYDSIDI